MDIFEFRRNLVADYATFDRSFIQIKDERILDTVSKSLEQGQLWPDPLIQLNPSFAKGGSIEELVADGLLHPECGRIFKRNKDDHGNGSPLTLHRHQREAIEIAAHGNNYVLTTGTGSGKSLSYIIPIVDYVLKHGSGKGVKAIIVYPMNALANSQMGELEKFLQLGYPQGKQPVTFARYTGQEGDEERKRIQTTPPDILLTNYVMLELILTRVTEKKLVSGAQGLRFLVLDELHTYRGRQGADVALLVRRVRDRLRATDLQCVGTSATLATDGSATQRQAAVAQVATQLFGKEVKPEHIINETLTRSTPDEAIQSPDFVAKLKSSVDRAENWSSLSYEDYVSLPLAVWVESTFGVTSDTETGRLVRAKPISISGSNGAAAILARAVGLAQGDCERHIQTLLLQSYKYKNPSTGAPPFAFRLHQFISRGDSVYASLESEVDRHITLQAQQFVPGKRTHRLFPLVFCRECGQEYYCVREVENTELGGKAFLPRQFLSPTTADEGDRGYLYVSTANPWPHGKDAETNQVPDHWVDDDEGPPTIRKDCRKYLPIPKQITPDGRQTAADGQLTSFISGPFRFCMSCGVSYNERQRSDYQKLTTLGSGGRSTATTILSISAIRHLRNTETLPKSAQKLLSFTDNRQDASLQSGHFNDFIDVALLRAALYAAVERAGSQGIEHDVLTQRVFEALQLKLADYAVDPTVKFDRFENTKRALKYVLGYRLYRDLERGWRVTSPNLEQCGLLEIQYLSLPELCRAEEEWASCHPALQTASPQTRQQISRVLLDHMRRELAIKADVLHRDFQDNQVRQASRQHLRDPWALDDQEELMHATVLYPRAQQRGDYRGRIYLSERGGFGQYLRRAPTFPEFSQRLTLEDTRSIIQELLQVLRVAGLVEIIDAPSSSDEVPGYQLPASAMIWRAGAGRNALHDPIRMPNQPEGGLRTNLFFVDFYKHVAASLHNLKAHEHTAQVPAIVREERERQFRAGDLPILYCSPTMELGVDISDLNVVNLRNMPPTPANYAQRSGRAGRSGQPALVFSYCTTGSPHDQFFFRRPNQMVAGAVTPPRLDLSSEDLVRSHINAIWLEEAGLNLGSSLTEILNTENHNQSLPLKDFVTSAFEDPDTIRRTQQRAAAMLERLYHASSSISWLNAEWLSRHLKRIPYDFDECCNRWRGLYRAAYSQIEVQHKIVNDASRPKSDKNMAVRLRAEAEAQLRLLTETESLAQSDFYSYRYLASEGFLPGYNFPRLPLSAFIPGRRERQGSDEYISRPRFLAISEFGPRSIVYHEGAQYTISRVILPPSENGEREFTTHQVKHCPECGYVHPAHPKEIKDLCEHCGTALGPPIRQLFRLQNVTTQRRHRINCDEEERMRLGYEVKTGVRFADRNGQPQVLRSQVSSPTQGALADLTCGQRATIWRINMGWSNSAASGRQGFVLDQERGYWAKNESEEDEGEDPLGKKTVRVIPYVEDHRNSLLFKPRGKLDVAVMASLQAALKNAIQIVFQLESSELAAEPLPDNEERNLILFFEATEGGAGVLKQLVEDNRALKKVARQALINCHFDPATGNDLRRAEGAYEDCEAACYDCLMNYHNQRDHTLLDRHRIKDILLLLADASVDLAPAGGVSRPEHLNELLKLCDSDLEKQWLHMVQGKGYRLPNAAQRLVPRCGTRPDFLYEGSSNAAIYIDGPHHEFPDRQRRDQEQQLALEDIGFEVIRFGLQDDWHALLQKCPHIFGNGKTQG